MSIIWFGGGFNCLLHRFTSCFNFNLLNFWGNRKMQQERGMKYFPISLFASVMGFSGFTIATRQIETVYEKSHIISLVFLIFATILFLLNASILLYRLIRYTNEVVNDFNHPVKINFFAAISISLLLLAIPYYDISQSLSFVIWGIGALLQLSLTLIILTKLIKQTTYQTEHFNPAWFIPIVGNIVVPLVGIHHVSSDILWIFYSIGITFSIIYMTIFINRVFFHPSIPRKLLPTMFILMAPPSVGFLSYLKLVGTVDAFASILYGIAFFIGLLLVFQIKTFLKIPFFLSWWAFLFPSAAVTIATIQMYVETSLSYYQWIFNIQTIGLILLIFYLTWKTLQLAVMRKLCLKE